MFQPLGSWHLRQWARAALIAAAFAAILYIIVAAWPIIVPLLLGLILAWIILPAVNWLELGLLRLLHNRSAARLTAILIVYAVVLGLIVLFAIYFVPRLFLEIELLVARVPEIITSLQFNLAGLRRWYMMLPPSVQVFIQSQLPATPGGLLAVVERDVLRGITNIFHNSWAVVFGYIIVPFWLIYVLYDSERLHRATLSLLPESAWPDSINIGHILNDVAGAYLRGQLLFAASIGFLTGLGLYLLGVGFAVVLGFLTAIVGLIPTIGPILAAIPVVIIAAIQRPILAVWALLVIIGVRQFGNLFIGPGIIGTRVRVRPGLIIVLLLIAGYLWGFLGLLLAVPVTAALRDVYRYLYLRTSPKGISPGEALLRVRRPRHE